MICSINGSKSHERIQAFQICTGGKKCSLPQIGALRGSAVHVTTGYIISYKIHGENVAKCFFYLLFFRIFVEISIFNKSLV